MEEPTIETTKQESNETPMQSSDSPNSEPVTDGITIKQACDLTGRGKTTIKKWADSGILRTSTDEKGTRLVSAADVHAADASHKTRNGKVNAATENIEMEPATEVVEPPEIIEFPETDLNCEPTARIESPTTSSVPATPATAEAVEILDSIAPTILRTVTQEEKVELKLVSFDETTQIRAKISQPTVADYAKKMKNDERFPPVVLFRAANNSFYIGDGWHRLLAAKKAGYHTFLATVYDGGKTEAIRYALKANVTHGMRLTSADRWKKVQVALQEYPTLSNNALADMCSVSEGLVRRIRDTFVKNEPETRTGTDGKQYPARKGSHEVHTIKMEERLFKRTTKLAQKLPAARLRQLQDAIGELLSKMDSVGNPLPV